MGQVSAERIAAVADWVRQSGDDLSLHRAAGMAEVMTAALSDPAEPDLVADFDALAREIDAVRREIAAAQTSAILVAPRVGLPEAGKELEEVVAATEEASNAIMTACEDILGADAEDIDAYQTLVAERVTSIFEACSFQDLAGQRISKVLGMLRAVDGRIDTLTERLRLAGGIVDEEDLDDAGAEPSDLRARALLLFGPQARACAQSQDDIDRLFSEVASQDEIDQLFD